jgi:hypothetical protein
MEPFSENPQVEHRWRVSRQAFPRAILLSPPLVGTSIRDATPLLNSLAGVGIRTGVCKQTCIELQRRGGVFPLEKFHSKY